MKTEIKNLQHIHHKIYYSEGVSLISLVITIIVVIILAAITFGTSTRTITNANYSDYVNSVAEVRQAFHTRAITVKGKYAAMGIVLTDAQVYDYVARNGKTQSDIRVKSEIPNYTIIKDEGQFGIALPKLKIEAGDIITTGKALSTFESKVYAGKMVNIKYAVTPEGEIFTWPPFEYEGKFAINDKDTAISKTAENITVGGKTFAITLTEDTAELTEEGHNGKVGLTLDYNGGAGPDGNSSYTFTLPQDEMTMQELENLANNNMEFLASFEMVSRKGYMPIGIVDSEGKTLGDDSIITNDTVLTYQWQKTDDPMYQAVATLDTNGGVFGGELSVLSNYSRITYYSYLIAEYSRYCIREGYRNSGGIYFDREGKQKCNVATNEDILSLDGKILYVGWKDEHAPYQISYFDSHGIQKTESTDVSISNVSERISAAREILTRLNGTLMEGNSRSIGVYLDSGYTRRIDANYLTDDEVMVLDGSTVYLRWETGKQVTIVDPYSLDSETGQEKVVDSFMWYPSFTYIDVKNNTGYYASLSLSIDHYTPISRWNSSKGKYELTIAYKDLPDVLYAYQFNEQ